MGYGLHLQASSNTDLIVYADTDWTDCNTFKITWKYFFSETPNWLEALNLYTSLFI